LEYSFEIIKENDLKGHNGAIYKLNYDALNDVIYSAGGDGWIVKWDAFGKNEDGFLVAQTDAKIFSMLTIAEHNLIIAGDMDGHIYWIDVPQSKVISRVVAHKKSVFDLIRLCENKVASAGKDGVITIWSLEHFRPELSVQVNAKGLRCLVYDNKRQIIYAGGSDNHIYQIDPQNLNLSIFCENAHKNSVFSMLHYTDNRLISGGRDAHMKSWNISTQAENLLSLPAHWYTINDMEIIDNQWLATASRDKSIRIWSLPDLNAVKLLDVQKGGHVNSVNSLAWVPKHQLLFSAGDDRIIKVWKINKK
jgi:WD40 repeat protein